MGADAGEGGEPAGIGTAEHADLAAVAGKVLHQPVDGVEGVGGFVDAVRVLRVPLRAQGDELAAGAEAPADVLTHEDVAVLGELAVRAGHGGVPERAGGGERGADEEDREGLWCGSSGSSATAKSVVPSRTGMVSSRRSYSHALLRPGGCDSKSDEDG